MSALSLSPPFPTFADVDGDPLESGYIYLGTAGLNAQTNPIQAYWDTALTVPASQPIRTIGGYPSNNGAAARIYVNALDCSILVKNKNSTLVFSSLYQTDRIASSLVSFLQAGTGAVERSSLSKMRESVSVTDFGATGNGVTNDTAAIQAAIVYAYANNKSVYFPSGTYLMASTITMGNNTHDAATFMRFYGDGNNSVIYVSADNVTAFAWVGPFPDVFGAGNQIDGRIVIENMLFKGPVAFGNVAKTSSIGVKFYGVQGITLRNVSFQEWTYGSFFQNVDLVNQYQCYYRLNYTGIMTAATGAALSAGGNLNSLNIYGGLIAGNAKYGINYYGGLCPAFYGVNFVGNETSIIMSPNDALGNPVTSSPLISGCYFESDFGSTIILGGGTGIVRSPIIQGGFVIADAAFPVIKVANAANSFGIGHINIPINLIAPAVTKIDQSTSASKIDFFSFNDIPIGAVTPSTGVFSTITGVIGSVAANNGTFLTATATKFTTLNGSGTVQNGVPLELFVITTGTTYLVTVQTGNASGLSTTALIHYCVGGNPVVRTPFVEDSANFVLSVSGASIRITNNLGGAVGYFWSAIEIL